MDWLEKGEGEERREGRGTGERNGRLVGKGKGKSEGREGAVRREVVKEG